MAIHVGFNTGSIVNYQYLGMGNGIQFKIARGLISQILHTNPREIAFR